jgi:hypothetical protein
MGEKQAAERLESILSKPARLVANAERLAEHFRSLDASALDVAIEDFCESIGSALNSIDGTAVDAVALSDTLREIGDLLKSELLRLEVSQ